VNKRKKRWCQGYWKHFGRKNCGEDKERRRGIKMEKTKEERKAGVINRKATGC